MALPNESDDCSGGYAGFGFGLADRPLGIYFTESAMPDGKFRDEIDAWWLCRIIAGLGYRVARRLGWSDSGNPAIFHKRWR
ncbi:MAG: hypothetical protein IT525_06965 [Nitrosomonas sp.]|jgi:hypothetical protein|nr:hypothetical protein [Nitrosomonas sp.]